MEIKKQGRGRPKKIEPKVEPLSFSERHQKIERRGRPKEIEPEDRPSKFEKIFTEKSGIIHVWKYDLKKSNKGPIEVEIKYPKDYKDEVLENDESLPLTKRQWINPQNGKLVGYGRAVQLGIFKPEGGKKGRKAK